MRKVCLTIGVILVAAFIVTSCDDYSFLIPKVTPPNWIIGTWQNADGKVSWEFSSNDAILTVIDTKPGITETATASMQDQFDRDGPFFSSNSRLFNKYTIKTMGSKHEFIRVSDTTMDYTLSVYPDEPATIQLTKQ